MVLTEGRAILGSRKVLDIEVCRTPGLLESVAVHLSYKLLDLQPAFRVFTLTTYLCQSLLIKVVDGLLNRLIGVHRDEAVTSGL